MDHHYLPYDPLAANDKIIIPTANTPVSRVKRAPEAKNHTDKADNKLLTASGDQTGKPFGRKDSLTYGRHVITIMAL